MSVPPADNVVLEMVTKDDEDKYEYKNNNTDNDDGTVAATNNVELSIGYLCGYDVSLGYHLSSEYVIVMCYKRTPALVCKLLLPGFSLQDSPKSRSQVAITNQRD